MKAVISQLRQEWRSPKPAAHRGVTGPFKLHRPIGSCIEAQSDHHATVIDPPARPRAHRHTGDKYWDRPQVTTH
jgi:hypothetical protein